MRGRGREVGCRVVRRGGGEGNQQSDLHQDFLPSYSFAVVVVFGGGCCCCFSGSLLLLLLLLLLFVLYV